MQISGIHHLRDLLGQNLTFFSSTASAGLSPTGATFFGTRVIAIPLEDFSVGRAYHGDFIEISTEWYQTRLGSDFHQFCAARVSRPSDAGPPIIEPDIGQYPFKDYPNFHGDYFRAPVTQIEVLESTLTTQEIGGDGVEQIVFDSHIRFVAGLHEVVLTVEQGTILGEIELHAGRLGTLAPHALDAARARIVIEM